MVGDCKCDQFSQVKVCTECDVDCAVSLRISCRPCLQPVEKKKDRQPSISRSVPDAVMTLVPVSFLMILYSVLELFFAASSSASLPLCLIHFQTHNDGTSVTARTIYKEDRVEGEMRWVFRQDQSTATAKATCGSSLFRDHFRQQFHTSTKQRRQKYQKIKDCL